jgi:hypothetical protein
MVCDLHRFLQKETFLCEEGEFQHFFVAGCSDDVVFVAHGGSEEGDGFGVVEEGVAKASEDFLMGVGVADVTFAGDVAGVVFGRREGRCRPCLDQLGPAPIEVAIMREVEKVKGGETGWTHVDLEGIELAAGFADELKVEESGSERIGGDDSLTSGGEVRGDFPVDEVKDVLVFGDDFGYAAAVF